MFQHFVTVAGNSMSRKQTGSGYECTYTRTVSGDAMTLVSNVLSVKVQ